MKRLTKKQAIVLTGYTGVLMCEMSLFHEDVEKRLGRSVFIHEMASKEWWWECKKVYEQDFLNILPVFEMEKH